MLCVSQTEQCERSFHTINSYTNWLHNNIYFKCCVYPECLKLMSRHAFHHTPDQLYVNSTSFYKPCRGFLCFDAFIFNYSFFQ